MRATQLAYDRAKIPGVQILPGGPRSDAFVVAPKRIRDRAAGVERLVEGENRLRAPGVDLFALLESRKLALVEPRAMNHSLAALIAAVNPIRICSGIYRVVDAAFVAGEFHAREPAAKG
jgi:hypothetical protein